MNLIASSGTDFYLSLYSIQDFKQKFFNLFFPILEESFF